MPAESRERVGLIDALAKAAQAGDHRILMIDRGTVVSVDQTEQRLSVEIADGDSKERLDSVRWTFPGTPRPGSLCYLVHLRGMDAMRYAFGFDLLDVIEAKIADRWNLQLDQSGLEVSDDQFSLKKDGTGFELSDGSATIKKSNTSMELMFGTTGIKISSGKIELIGEVDQSGGAIKSDTDFQSNGVSLVNHPHVYDDNGTQKSTATPTETVTP